jgi:hypothetical protein
MDSRFLPDVLADKSIVEEYTRSISGLNCQCPHLFTFEDKVYRCEWEGPVDKCQGHYTQHSLIHPNHGKTQKCLMCGIYLPEKKLSFHIKRCHKSFGNNCVIEVHNKKRRIEQVDNDEEDNDNKQSLLKIIKIIDRKTNTAAEFQAALSTTLALKEFMMK